MDIVQNSATNREDLKSRLERAELRVRELEQQATDQYDLDRQAQLHHLEVANAAHSFANILTVIQAFVQQLPGSADAEALADVSDAIKHAKRLARRLVHWDDEDDPEVLCPAAMVRDFSRIARVLMPSAVYIDLDLDEDAGDILAPPRALLDVLLNLTLNAKDAMPAGTLKLHVGERSGDVIITVEDTGTGMTPETKSKMFEPYFTTKPRLGSGIGLSALKLLFDRVEGHVEVTSSVGDGTTFILCFPRVRRLAPLGR